MLSTFWHAFVLLFSMASLFPQLLALSTNSDPRPTTRYLTGPTEALEPSTSKLPQTYPLGSPRKWLGASGFSDLLGDSSPDHPIPLSGFASPASCPVVKDLIPIISPSSCNTHSHSVPLTEHCYWHCRYGVREGEFPKKNETGTLQEQITFNEARTGSSQISELLH